MPARSENLHRPLLVTPGRLQDIVCHHEQRRVSRQLALSYDRKRLILTRTAFAEGAAEQHVDIDDFSDGRLGVCWKGVSLPDFTFDKDQRVTHAAIVASRFLGETLAWIKARQDSERPLPLIKTNSEARATARKVARRGAEPPRQLARAHPT